MSRWLGYLLKGLGFAGKSVWGWIAPYILQWILKQILDLGQKAIDKWKKKQATDEYQKAVQNPELSREERKDAEDKFLNS